MDDKTKDPSRPTQPSSTETPLLSPDFMENMSKRAAQKEENRINRMSLAQAESYLQKEGAWANPHVHHRIRDLTQDSISSEGRSFNDDDWSDPEPLQGQHQSAENYPQVHQQAASAKAANHENSRRKAESIWMVAAAAPADHPYLIAKNVQSHGLKLDDGQLVVPMRIGDTLHSLQFINVGGKKRFLTGGRKKGCYQLVGTPGEVLCIAEGYATAASIHEATGYPVAVAFDAGNLKPVGEELARHYPDSRLLFCADNDRTTDGNLGLSKAKLAAKAVGGSVAVPEFPVGTPGTDFNDLLQACGSDALQTTIGKALAWPEPLPISVLLQRQQYPIDALPPDMRNAIEEVRSFVQAPVPMIATSAFGALALAIQGLVDVRRADTLTGPVSLFTLTIAESGERKTTVDNYFTTAVREYEMEKGKELEPDVHAYRTSLTVWNAKHQGLQDKIRTLAKNDKPTDESEVKLAELEREKPRPVKVPHLIRTDETPEHLAIALQDEWPSAGIVSSEAGTVLGSHAMNQESVMRNLSQFNTLWDGGELQYGRVTRDSLRLRDVRLSVSLQVQPGALKVFLDKHGALARGNGFLARFLIAWPESTQGFRLMTDPPKSWPALSAFNLRIRELLNMGHRLTDKGGIDPFLMELNPDARAQWRECHDAIEIQLRPGEPLSEIKDVASKAADNVARLAALIHIFCYGPNGAVGPESISTAFQVVSWHINETRRFLGEFSLPEELAKAALLDDWLRQRCLSQGISEIGKREVSQYGPNALRRKQELDEALKVLEEHHRIKLDYNGHIEVIKLNPALLECVAEVAVAA